MVFGVGRDTGFCWIRGARPLPYSELTWSPLIFVPMFISTLSRYCVCYLLYVVGCLLLYIKFAIIYLLLLRPDDGPPPPPYLLLLKNIRKLLSC